jgi:hypothetical protein
VLRHPRWWFAHRVCQFVDSQLVLAQRPQQPHPSGVSQHPEDLDGQVHLFGGRLRRSAYLRICAHTRIVTVFGHEVKPPACRHGHSQWKCPGVSRPLIWIGAVKLVVKGWADAVGDFLVRVVAMIGGIQLASVNRAA